MRRFCGAERKGGGAEPEQKPPLSGRGEKPVSDNSGRCNGAQWKSQAVERFAKKRKNQWKVRPFISFCLQSELVVWNIVAKAKTVRKRASRIGNGHLNNVFAFLQAKGGIAFVSLLGLIIAGVAISETIVLALKANRHIYPFNDSRVNFAELQILSIIRA